MTRQIFCAAAIAVAAHVTIPSAAAQNPTRPAAMPPMSTVLPVDAKIKVGVLPNGIRYYIREHHKPEKRAELRLVVNAGSILEDEDQLGLAHFVEHTAFNGTTHYKKNDLVSYLESIGVRFGADLNAYTGFDETVYILPIPTDTARIVTTAFQILEDWAHGQIFDSTEVANERGVVLEEWRGGKGASERMLQQWLPIAFKGSRYAARVPIGTDASIQSATVAKLRRFYRDWYRPDLMAVVAVGDFKTADIEALIKKHFRSIPRVAAQRKRATFGVPANSQPLVAIATDKEATSSSVQVDFKLPHQEIRTVGDYRAGLVAGLYLGMFNTRLAEIAQRPDAPFLGAGAGKGKFVGVGRMTDAFTLGAGVADGKMEQGLEALLVEAKRADTFGFLQSELDREKQDLVRAYERAYLEREKNNSETFVGELVNNFLVGEAIPGIEYEYKLVQQLVPTITLADVNNLARSWITDENRVVIASAPDKAGVKVSTAAELLAVFDRAARATVVAYTENVSGDALVDALPAPGSVVRERMVPEVNVTEWTLSNGVRVLVKPTDFKADQVIFAAYSNGGTSLVRDEDYMSAALASQIASLSGVGRFNRIDLGKKLSGKSVSVQPSIGATSEGLSGSASPKDLETLFQLVYLYFTAPRLDTAAYLAFKNQAAQYLANRGADPDEVFGDTIDVTLAQHHFRERPLTAQTFAEVNPEKAIAILKDRFADASDFTFVFVGTVEPATLKPLVERYLATLAATGRKEMWRDVGATPPSGVVERVVRKGTEAKANTLIVFSGPFEWSPANRFALRALTDYFQIKLNESLREQLGGTYSPGVSFSPTRIPRPQYSMRIRFGSSPENVEKLTKTVFALIDTLRATGPSASDVEKVREQLVRSREIETKQNSYWLGGILTRDQSGEDIAGLLGPYDAMVRALTPQQIQAAARTYFNVGNYVRLVLLPEAPKTTP